MQMPVLRCGLALSLAAAINALSGLAWSNAAHAGDVCVVCSDPVATYRCEIAGADGAKPQEPGLQLACIKQIATRGGHGSCSVNTRVGGPCDGVLVVIEAQSVDRPTPPVADNGVPKAPVILPPVNEGVSEATGGAPPAGSAAPGAPPATVEALAKIAAEQTKKDWEKTKATVNDSAQAAGQQVTKAGATVGSVFKKSWDCLSTLFTGC